MTDEMTFQKLRKLSKQELSSELPQVKLTLMGDCATQLLAVSVDGQNVFEPETYSLINM